MDSLQIELVKFQKKHKIVDVNEQARMSLDVVSRLESEIMLSEARLELLVRSNGERSSEVAQEKVSLGILRNKLSEIEKKSGADILPGLMNSLDLSIPYYRLVKEIDAKTKVLVYLGQQLESERISEAKSIKRLAVVDRPWKAEYKSKPKRLLLLAVILVFGNLFVFGCFVLRYYWRFHFSKNVVVRRFSEAIGA
jgi:capsule polysaccharide export protein KpsE/RkpR